MVQNDLDAAIQDTSDAIDANPNYVKAYTRRFTAYERKEKWHEATADIKKAIELDRSLESIYGNRMRAAEMKSKQQFEKEKDEMVGKLKDFGNFCLGKVGLSLDNFKMEKNDDSGSYNISFQQNQDQQPQPQPQ
eukprot:GHVU01050656.1.p1 GENE.GHVU01050656.1~~GHVU01050656.1.p1  ORF type:complete len:134 (+),score=36.51 GHVU01050656.1:514-915(+)